MFEINLVPDVKAETIKAQRKRNFVLFGCFVVSAISIGIVIFLGAIRAGQEITIASQNNRLELMEKKIGEYSSLDELLTIKRQLSGVSELSSDKLLSSRIFTILASIVPTGADTVTISSATLDLAEARMGIEGQANAGAGTDGIDYRVLESFVKQIGLTKYDYGRYVDSNGEEIPTMCISETDSLGVPYAESGKNGEQLIYAIWTKGVKGCDPSGGESEESVSEEEVEEAVNEAEEGTSDEQQDEGSEEQGEGEQQSEGQNQSSETVKIYRTPKFDEWYKQAKMDLDGTITGIPHFVSECIEYSGVQAESNNRDVVKWVTNNSCDVTEEGFEVTESSNGRQEGGDLVLRFAGRIYFDPEIFNFNNKHMIAIAPSGRVNVTDSLLQVESIFGERAEDCDPSDAACSSGR
ncbi:hypothetical protein IKG02_00925 [Candidatus Saccharibacteria bacterium]|nr:hypothetical protein [Candidatus Saccharibacteria bacterium]